MNDYDRWKLESREDEEARRQSEDLEYSMMNYIDSVVGGEQLPRQPACGDFDPTPGARSLCTRCGRAFTAHGRDAS